MAYIAVLLHAILTVMHLGFVLQCYHRSIHDYLVSVPTPMIIANVTGTVYAGIPLILSCDYTLSISVDTDITTSATWTITCTGTVTGGTSATANDDVTINVMGLSECVVVYVC